MTLLSAKAFPNAPPSTKNIDLGPLVIKRDGLAKIMPYDPNSSDDEGERVKLTQVKTVGALCKINFSNTTVLVWHQNVRLTNDLTFFPVSKKKVAKAKSTTSSSSSASKSSSSSSSAAKSSSSGKSKK
jgi:hypothetical protein